MKDHAPFLFEFEAVTISYGMGEDYSFLSEHCKKYGISHSIYQTEIFEIAKEKIRKNSSFCSFFSRMRRGSLYTFALNNGFNKLALGHHLDDAIESFFMNLFYNGSMRSMPPIYRAYNGIFVIRPLIFARERQLKDFAISNNFKTIGDEACPAMRFDIKMPYNRDRFKEIISNLEKEHKTMIASIKRAFENIHDDFFFDKSRFRLDRVNEENQTIF